MRALPRDKHPVNDITLKSLKTMNAKSVYVRGLNGFRPYDWMFS